MKNLLLVLAITVSFLSCKKDESKSPTSNEVECVFSTDNARIYHGCVKTKDELAQKIIQLRDAGYLQIETTKKSTCSECN